MLPKPAPVASADFYPALTSGGGKQLAMRTISGAALVEDKQPDGCTDGAQASSCVSLIAAPTGPPSTAPLFHAPQSDFTNTTGGTQYSPGLTTVWPSTCAPSTWLLGELSKFVPVSEQRFSAIQCSGAGGVEAQVHGEAGESCTVTALKGGKGKQPEGGVEMKKAEKADKV